MKIACILAALSLAACVYADDQPDTYPPGQPAPDPTHALPSDQHYVEIIAPYTSPEDCLANAYQPFICLFSLSLCKNGRVGERQGDLVRSGNYAMESSIAHATFYYGPNSTETLDFDVQSVTEVGAPNAHWIIDTAERWNTLQFDNIACDQP